MLISFGTWVCLGEVHQKRLGWYLDGSFVASLEELMTVDQVVLYLVVLQSRMIHGKTCQALSRRWCTMAVKRAVLPRSSKSVPWHRLYWHQLQQSKQNWGDVVITTYQTLEPLGRPGLLKLRAGWVPLKQTLGLWQLLDFQLRFGWLTRSDYRREANKHRVKCSLTCWNRQKRKMVVSVSFKRLVGQFLRSADQLLEDGGISRNRWACGYL